MGGGFCKHPVCVEPLGLKRHLVKEEAASRGQQRGSQQSVLGSRFPNMDPNREILLREKLRKTRVMLCEGFISFLLSFFFLFCRKRFTLTSMANLPLFFFLFPPQSLGCMVVYSILSPSGSSLSATWPLTDGWCGSTPGNEPRL